MRSPGQSGLSERERGFPRSQSVMTSKSRKRSANFPRPDKDVYQRITEALVHGSVVGHNCVYDGVRYSSSPCNERTSGGVHRRGCG